jgi:hypothetical protein
MFFQLRYDETQRKVFIDLVEGTKVLGTLETKGRELWLHDPEGGPSRRISDLTYAKPLKKYQVN